MFLSLLMREVCEFFRRPVIQLDRNTCPTVYLNRFEGRDGEQAMLALCLEGLMDVADSVAVTSVFPPALTTALLETLRRGDEKGLLGEQHYLDWVSAVSWSHFWQYLVALGHT